MTNWTKTDKDLALELALYVAAVRLRDPKVSWVVGQKGSPWQDYYLNSSALFRKMRPSRRRRVIVGE
jgi:hypothetical protein